MESTVEKSTKKKVILGVIAGIFITTIITMSTLAFLLINKDTIYNEVYIETINVSNLTKQQATQRVENIFGRELEGLKLNLVYENYSRQLPYKDVGYTYLYDDAVEEAYRLGREGNIFNRISNIYALKKNPVYISLQPHYEEEFLESFIEDIEEHINKDAKDATIRRQNGAFQITKEQLGIEIDKDLLVERIIERIETFSQKDISIPISHITPSLTEETLKNIQEVVGEFSTVFNLQMEGRSQNISIAARSINGTLLMPGEGFSFNEKAAGRGYQEAPVIIDGKLVPGIGGGICQVSTTLYNAVVRGNLEVTSRRNHSLSVPYVPLGHDAAVANNHIDFQFKNNFQNPIYIDSFVVGDKVFVKLYGKKEDNFTITLLSDVIEVIEPKIETKKDPDMFIGEKKVEVEPKKGYRVNTYKIYSQNGKEIKREHISRDNYAVVNGVIIEGTKPNSVVEGEVTSKADQLLIEESHSQQEEIIESQEI
ncbi:G5 domain-containing protein [Anaerovirgula multivorans]|uniref:G5 domain-containing protein n=1 Tax=Anaerovirgula multivorans TaxID=312168 RepID=A0A239H4W2_9FIRM|nr:VanW family protein [Anaerovirgula multivorans]SNS76496.1 G5 domain-containing protein [Anaerovirgula multivorans]